MVNVLPPTMILRLYSDRVQHGKADALSRCSGFKLRPEDDACAQQSCCLLRPDQLQMFATCMLLDVSLVSNIAKEMAIYAFSNEIMVSIKNPSKKKQRSNIKQFSFQDGLLYKNNLLHVLEGSCRTRALHDCHDDPLIGHFGVTKTL